MVTKEKLTNHIQLNIPDKGGQRLTLPVKLEQTDPRGYKYRQATYTFLHLLCE